MADTSASSGSAAATSSGNALSSCANRSPAAVEGQIDVMVRQQAGRKAQSRAACAWRIASTMYPCGSCHPAAARCNDPIALGVARRSSS